MGGRDLLFAPTPGNPRIPRYTAQNTPSNGLISTADPLLWPITVAACKVGKGSTTVPFGLNYANFSESVNARDNVHAFAGCHQTLQPRGRRRQPLVRPLIIKHIPVRDETGEQLIQRGAAFLEQIGC